MEGGGQIARRTLYKFQSLRVLKTGEKAGAGLSNACFSRLHSLMMFDTSRVFRGPPSNSFSTDLYTQVVLNTFYMYITCR